MQIWTSSNSAAATSGENGLACLPSHYHWLPFASADTDLVVVHHVLEQERSYHPVLREVTRVIKPYGYLLILGFNAYSSWGLRSLLDRGYHLGRQSQVLPWGLSFCGAGRLCSALDLLGFEIRQQFSFAYHLPFNVKVARPAQRAMAAWQGYGGAINLILAQKIVRGMTPIMPRWRQQSTIQTASIRQLAGL